MSSYQITQVIKGCILVAQTRFQLSEKGWDSRCWCTSKRRSTCREYAVNWSWKFVLLHVKTMLKQR